MSRKLDHSNDPYKSQNRAERRRTQSKRRQRDENFVGHVAHLRRGPMRITIVPTNHIFDPSLDPEIFNSIVQLTAKVMADERPICLTCDFEWINLRCPPPAAVAVVRTQDFFCDPNADKVLMMVSGICRTCWENHYDDLLERCFERYRKIWPDLRTADIHEAPVGVQ